MFTQTPILCQHSYCNHAFIAIHMNVDQKLKKWLCSPNYTTDIHHKWEQVIKLDINLKYKAWYYLKSAVHYYWEYALQIFSKLKSLAKHLYFSNCKLNRYQLLNPKPATTLKAITTSFLWKWIVSYAFWSKNFCCTYSLVCVAQFIKML